MASTTFNGPVTSENGFVGNVTGDLTGNLAASQLKQVEGTIVAADITATTAGKFGHAAGYPMVADPGAGKVLEFISCVLIYDRATATYGAGGNITVNTNGGSAITGVVSAANSVGSAADAVAIFNPLTTAALVATALVNKGFNLVAASAFTNPGTAAGVIRYKVTYREWATGL